MYTKRQICAGTKNFRASSASDKSKHGKTGREAQSVSRPVCFFRVYTWASACSISAVFRMVALMQALCLYSHFATSFKFNLENILPPYSEFVKPSHAHSFPQVGREQKNGPAPQVRSRIFFAAANGRPHKTAPTAADAPRAYCLPVFSPHFVNAARVGVVESSAISPWAAALRPGRERTWAG